MFHVVVHIEQFHGRRDVEYLLFKKWLNETIMLLRDVWQTSVSCEQMASSILMEIEHHYQGRAVRVEVNEDNENGAIVSDE